MFAAGTVFNQLVVWSVSHETLDSTGHAPVLHRLQGHKVAYGLFASTAGPRVSFIIIIRSRHSRSAAAYSRQTFPWTICRSVLRRSVQCIVEKRQIGSGCRLS